MRTDLRRGASLRAGRAGGRDVPPINLKTQLNHKALYPLHCTATGKLLLSQRPDRCTGLTDARLLGEIEEARRTRIAWNRRESDPNIVAVATWVGNPHGFPVWVGAWLVHASGRARGAPLRRAGQTGKPWGNPSDVTPVICVKWPFFRFTETKARQALESIRRHLGSV